MKTFEERLMAFMNCPRKNTARCNLVCETCLHSDSEGLNDINRLTIRLEALKEDKNENYR